MLGHGEYGFSFDQYRYFAAPVQTSNAYLSQPTTSSQPGDYQTGSAEPHDSWQQFYGPLNDSSCFQPPQAPLACLGPPAEGRGQIHSALSTSTNKQGNQTARYQSKLRSRLRQITLRQASEAPPRGKEAPTGHWMSQLSNINASLLELASALPERPSLNGPSSHGTSKESYKSHGFPINDMFKLTTQVAEILDSVCSSAGNNIGTSKKANERLDPGSSMFILSTYVRLLDMYQKVFSLVRNELSQTSAPLFRQWKLPAVTVGSFAVESSPPLQMSLAVQLAEEFLTRLRNATAMLENTKSKDARFYEDTLARESIFSEVVGISYKAVRSREESLQKYLAQLRGEIEALLDT